MEMLYKLILILVVLGLFIYLFKNYTTTQEGFEVNNTGNTGNTGNNEGMNPADVAANAVAAAANMPSENNTEETEEVESCKPRDWWEDSPVKAIRSKLWGASYNLIYQPDGNINSPVLVPINNPNSQAPPGCLSVTKTGWHQTAMCAVKNVDQRWIIKRISNQQEFEKAMEQAKNDGGTTGFTYGYKMDKVDYPFFIVVAKDYPSQALYYNGSALGVRPIGNYDDQKWDILAEEVKDPITTNDFNFYSKLTPELQASQSSLDSNMAGTALFGSQNLMTPEALKALLENIMKQPNTNGAFGINGGLKINVEMDDGIISQLAGDSGVVNVSNSLNNSTEIIEPFTSKVVYYPKKNMDIAVTLNYATSNVEQTEKKKPDTEIVSIQDIDPEGNLVNIGETEMKMIDTETGRKLCNDTKCHPDMRDWVSKPYPCRACVPNESETW
jgi:hypothetical protein